MFSKFYHIDLRERLNKIIIYFSEHKSLFSTFGTKKKTQFFIFLRCQMWKIVIHFRKNISWFGWAFLSKSSLDPKIIRYGWCQTPQLTNRSESKMAAATILKMWHFGIVSWLCVCLFAFSDANKSPRVMKFWPEV